MCSAQLELRQDKRYKAHASPLMQLGFWRVILDESQMIESVGSSPAEMALRLQVSTIVGRHIANENQENCKVNG